MTTPADLSPGAEPAARDRYDIDPLRGFVCLSIVVVHAFFGSRAFADSHQSVGWCVAHFRLGYESFFVLAGLFLAYSFRDDKDVSLSTPNYLRRRFLRLLVPYWCAVFLAWLDRFLPNVLLGHHNPLPSPLEMAATLAAVQNLVGTPNLNAAHWTMCCMIQAIVLWTLAFRFCRQVLSWCGRADAHSRTVSLLVWVAFVSSMFELYMLSSSSVARSPSGVFQIHYLTLGGLVYLGAKNGRWALPVTLCIAMVGCGIATHSSRDLAAVLTACILSLLVRGYRFPPLRVIEWLRYLGRRSYSVYLVHMTAGFRILNLANHLGEGGWLSVVLFVGAVLAGVLCGLLFYRWIEEPIACRAAAIRYRL